jgi:undecaprenyl-diphosphatase
MSFPSTHATIAFAAAYVIGKAEKSWRGASFVLAVAVALSRIYLGNHYPSDVVVGALLGLLVGVVSMRLLRPVALKKKR